MAKHGRYKIIRRVADGGMAEIFLATQMGREGFQKPVILKRIHSTIYADPQFRNMFIDEAHISMSLSHSNIAQVLDLGVSAGRCAGRRGALRRLGTRGSRIHGRFRCRRLAGRQINGDIADRLRRGDRRASGRRRSRQQLRHHQHDEHHQDRGAYQAFFDASIHKSLCQP